MELSERCIQTLENEGYNPVYEEAYGINEARDIQTDGVGLTIFVTEGTLTVILKGVHSELLPGQRITVSPHSTCTAQAGAEGCQVVIGEKGA